MRLRSAERPSSGPPGASRTRTPAEAVWQRAAVKLVEHLVPRETPASIAPAALAPNLHTGMGTLQVLPPDGVPVLALRIHRGLLLAGRAEDLAHSLHLFGSAGIAAYGWAVCRLLGVPGEPWVPLWFMAGLLVYNFDRLRSDPADGVNIPRRTAAAARWRWLSRLLAVAAGLGLVLLPIFRRDWTTLALVLLGTPLCLHYSIPWRGRRLKDIPYLKSFFAPTLVVVAIVVLPLFHTPLAFPLPATPLVLAWAWGLALANMLLCDVRDVGGDLRTGVLSLPAEIGLPQTRRLLWALALVTGGLAGLLIFLGGQPARGAWMVLSLLPTLYLAALALAVGLPQSERFYERYVEGLLFLPALVAAFFL